jgi:stearoyl-CoA desaturase (delta-9 desaturase)
MENTAAIPRFWAWLSNADSYADRLRPSEREQLDKLRVGFFLAIHLGCLAVIWVGVSGAAVAAFFASYVARMFFVTAFYHRYFSHRAFGAGRITQFVMALLGCTAGQRGPLWWAGHHREHHLLADTPDDPHSPAHRGMWYAHTVWFLTKGSFRLRSERIRDWQRFPELRWLERFDWVPFVALGAGMYVLGEWLSTRYPGAGTSGWQMLVWGFFLSTVALYHATYTINSLAHRYGSRRFSTRDSSRNNFLLALLTLGEGWHNNHHRYPVSARQGFFWWEVDVSFIVLRGLSALGIVRDLRPVPASVLREARRTDGEGR